MSLLLYAITDGLPTAEESAGIDGLDRCAR